jgi:hypothetical protein
MLAREKKDNGNLHGWSLVNGINAGYYGKIERFFWHS